MVLWIATAVTLSTGMTKGKGRGGEWQVRLIRASDLVSFVSSARKSTEMDVCYKKRGRSKEASRAAWGSSGPPNTEHKL